MSWGKERAAPVELWDRDKVAKRIDELERQQAAATGWGAAVGAREEELRNLRSTLRCIDAAATEETKSV